MARRSASANALEPGYTRPDLTTPIASRSTFTAIYDACVPVNTVWKRLHTARKEFLVLVARSRHQTQSAGPGGGWTKLGGA